MYGLTLHSPWAQAIVYGPKRVENRSWRPGAALGELIAIHCGETLDEEAVHMLRERDLYEYREELHHPGHIVGVARVVDVVEQSDDPWFRGPLGWILEDVRALDEPLATPGDRRLWLVDEELVAEIEEQIER
jgi:hypothetical protein